MKKTSSWKRTAKGASNVYDDINGRSLSFGCQQTSLGVSTVRIILHLIIERWPTVRAILHGKKSHLTSRHQLLFHSQRPEEAGGLASASIIDEKACIDAYFEITNAIAPMLDEIEFRSVQQRKPERCWLACPPQHGTRRGLFAISKEGSRCTHAYYESVRQRIGLDCFGSASIESLQALCLFGGTIYTTETHQIWPAPF